MSEPSKRLSCRTLGLALCDRCRGKRAGCVRNAEIEQAQQEAFVPARTTRGPSKFADDDTYRETLRDRSGMRTHKHADLAAGPQRDTTEISLPIAVQPSAKRARTMRPAKMPQSTTAELTSKSSTRHVQPVDERVDATAAALVQLRQGQNSIMRTESSAMIIMAQCIKVILKTVKPALHNGVAVHCTVQCNLHCIALCA